MCHGLLMAVVDNIENYEYIDMGIVSNVNY
jgi:hypothetical protein